MRGVILDRYSGGTSFDRYVVGRNIMLITTDQEYGRRRILAGYRRKDVVYMRFPDPVAGDFVDSVKAEPWKLKAGA